MVRTSKYINVWYVSISAEIRYEENFIAVLKSNNIIAERLEFKCDKEFGIVLVGGPEYYEQLISLLNIQIKRTSSRVIVINTSKAAFRTMDIMKIFSYGAEYFFESSGIDQNFECITQKINRWRNIESILQSAIVRQSIVGESRQLKRMVRDVIEVAVYSDASVLIMGERGTGKELVARLIHDINPANNKGNLVLVDCTTVKTELSNSEFFGHEKGSYTGADHTREGAFALANNGTLFLDEVGELPLQMQAELLRIIQEGTYKKIGSNIWRQANFRLICATNRNLKTEAESGNFRKDLLDRISLWKCYMPNLNERKEDIPLLVEFFLKKRFPDAMPVMDDGVIEYLKERSYPGNIRELQNLIKGICLRYAGKGVITLGDIPEYERVNYIYTQNNWYENPVLTDSITDALNSGYDAKHITDIIKSLTTKIALTITDNNKQVSQLLGKSERWIQLQKAKER